MHKKINPVLAVGLILVVVMICGILILAYFVKQNESISLTRQQTSQSTAITNDHLSGKESNADKPGNSQMFFDSQFRSDKNNIEFSYPSLLFIEKNIDNAGDKFEFDNKFSSGIGPNFYTIIDFFLNIEPVNGRNLADIKTSLINGSFRSGLWKASKSQYVSLADDPEIPTTAIRYEIAPREQIYPGYGYVFIKNGLLYNLDFECNASYIFDGQNNKIHEFYDSLGDNIAMTIRFIK
jgi:hypothetical protein